MGLWGRYDGMSFVGDALGSGRGWGSDRLLGPLRSATFRPRRVGEGVVGRVRCRHVDVRVAARALGADAPARISVLRRRHGLTLSHSRKASSGPGTCYTLTAYGSLNEYDQIAVCPNNYYYVWVAPAHALLDRWFSYLVGRPSSVRVRCSCIPRRGVLFRSAPVFRATNCPHCTYIIHDEIKQNYMLFGFA